MRNTLTNARQSVLQHWLLALDRIGLQEGAHYTYAKSESRITLQNGATLTAHGFVNSAGRPTEFRSILPEPSLIWVEEAINLTEAQFLSCDGLLRTGNNDQILMTLNPDTKTCFVYTAFIGADKHLSGHVHYSRPYDNPFTAKNTAYLETLSKIKDEELRKSWYLGEWASLSGTVYRYEIVDSMPEGLTPRYGVDFGYNDPMAVIEVAEADETEGRVLYIRQVIYQSGMTNADLAERMKYNVPSIAEIYADTASPDGIETLRRAGFVHVFGARKGKDSVLDGIKKVKEFIIRVVDDGKQKGLIDELDKYRWKEDAAGQQTDVPVDANNHLLDALRYAVFREEVKPRQPIQVIDFNF